LSAVVGIYLVLSGRFLRVISRYSVNIFFGDAWGFDYQILFQKQSLWSMFRLQYGPHRQGIGAIFSFLLGSWSHWDSRSEMLGAGLVVIGAAGCALYLKTRLYGPITYADSIIPLIILTPSQFESFAAYVNPAHGPFPALLMMLYCLAWTLGSPRWKYPCILLVNLALTCSGFGLFIGGLTPVLLGLDWYVNTTPRWSLVSLLFSIASLGSFFLS